MDIKVFILFLTLLLASSNARSLIDVCPQLPEQTLTTILGSAYNPRYMSIDEPRITVEPAMGNKRSSPEQDFFVDNNFHQEISDKPAWEVNHIPTINYNRNKRDTVETQHKRDYRQTFLDSITSPTRKTIFKSRPWECNPQIRWIDLGYQYFPRYIRTVECMRKECWYGHSKCVARSFTVKVLKRKVGECARINEKLVMASRHKITGEFTELWIWEEKAVNFCCDCVMV